MISRRLEMIEKMEGASERPETKNFGSVGCFKLRLTGVAETSCFLVDGGGYLALTLRSSDPKQIDLDTVKGFLEKAAALRK